MVAAWVVPVGVAAMAKLPLRCFCVDCQGDERASRTIRRHANVEKITSDLIEERVAQGLRYAGMWGMTRQMRLHHLPLALLYK